MKSTVETLGPTRVKLAVEVPFAELQPSLDRAYRSIAGQLRVPGFRPGRVPPPIIDRRVGRGAVLEEAIRTAVPEQYSAAVREHDVRVIGQPEVDVTELSDGQHLKFTAEVDVRPQITLPAFESLEVTVDAPDVDDGEVDEQLAASRERFALLKAVDRSARTGDFVSIDLAAAVDGAPLEEAATSGYSYEIGSGHLVDGLDEALEGATAGDERTFTTRLVGGDHAGEEAQVTVTVRSVKEKELPELDDDFAQSASEFATIEELRADIRARLGRLKRWQQLGQARDRALEALLAAVDVPLPEGIVQAEVTYREQTITEQLTAAGVALEDYLAEQELTAEQLQADLRTAAQQAVKGQLVLDAVAEAEQIGVSQEELTSELLRRAEQTRVAPEELARHLADSGQLALLAADVRRGKALGLVLQRAVVRDPSGAPVDLAAAEGALAAGAAPAEGTASAEGAAQPEASAAAGQPEPA